MPSESDSRRGLVAFASVSFTYFAYAGLFSTYAPLWFQNLGYSTLAIGALASMQSATRVFSPYVWGWLADHTGARTQLLRIAVVLSLFFTAGFFVSTSYRWIAVATVALFVATAGVIPISEAALAHRVSQGAKLDPGRYGRVRLWGSIGFIAAVVSGGVLLQRLGVDRFPTMVVLLLAALLAATLRLPVITEPPHGAEAVPSAISVLRRPVVGWFFGGVFFTVLAHTSLYAFLSLYLVSIGYSKMAVGLIWAIGVVAEVLWFASQGRWLARGSLYGWLLIAAVVSALRFALTAAFGSEPRVLVPLQCLHAVTFAAQHSACIGVINRHFPGRLRGRGQALYTVLGYGASGVVGGVAGGALSEAFGFASVFWAASAASVLAALCCWRSLVLSR